MHRTRVKICGITTRADAHVAAEAGADALGFNLYAESPRFIQPNAAAEIVTGLPPFVSCVAVFVNPISDEVMEICQRVPFDLLQFHGDETDQFCQQFERPWIKGVRVSPSMDLTAEAARYPHSRGLLLDARVEGKYGGTGETFDWQLVTALHKPVVLAGGLNPDNVARAIATAGPFAVDVSGGVERAPGVKDPDRIREFIQAASAGDSRRTGDWI